MSSKSLLVEDYRGLQYPMLVNITDKCWLMIAGDYTAIYWGLQKSNRGIPILTHQDSME